VIRTILGHSDYVNSVVVMSTIKSFLWDAATMVKLLRGIQIMCKWELW
jgi:hypothetical protein